MAIIRQNGAEVLQYAATSISAGNWVKCYGPAQAYQAVAQASSGAYTATVVIEGSNDGVNPVATLVGTISLSGTAPAVASDGFATVSAPWGFIRARVTALTGTGATVSTWMGC